MDGSLKRQIQAVFCHKSCHPRAPPESKTVFKMARVRGVSDFFWKSQSILGGRGGIRSLSRDKVTGVI